ncbi:hypothetical protein I3A86_24435, partial [Salmonella enterica]|nr:hypothetical protein [Salmonella enterica]
MLDLDETVIARHCGSRLTEEGRRLHLQARVGQFSRDVNTIRSTVRVSAMQRHRQVITLSECRDGIEITDSCTCTMRSGCKHIAAVLLHAIQLVVVADSAKARDPSPENESRSTSRSKLVAPDLAADLVGWVDDLARAAGTSGESGRSHVSQRVIYILMPMRD